MQAALAILVRDKVNELFRMGDNFGKFLTPQYKRQGRPKRMGHPLCIYVCPGTKATGNQSMMSKPQ